MKQDVHAPYTLYKSDISYFSGKMEAYLRYKGIPHKAIDCNITTLQKIARNTGVKKMPAMRTCDGKWLFDTTPMIQWFETIYTDPPILPEDPALAFVALLVEDYGDEWLWRPAMWWRWMPRTSRWTLGWRIGEAFFSAAIARPFGWYFGYRQRNEWLWHDGVDKKNSAAVRDMLFREFDFLEPLLEEQPYLLGSHPSAADFGYFASMFRHFGNDPESAEVMRREAPNTYEWLARLWNINIHKLPQEQSWVWPQAHCWQPLLKRIAGDYLPYLQQNAKAFAAGEARFNFFGASLGFNNTKTTHYRVWCLEALQGRFRLLNKQQRQTVQMLFEPHGGLGCLLNEEIIPSGLAGNFKLPIDPSSRLLPRQSLKTYLFGQPRN